MSTISQNFLVKLFFNMNLVLYLPNICSRVIMRSFLVHFFKTVEYINGGSLIKLVGLSSTMCSFGYYLIPFSLVVDLMRAQLVSSEDIS